MTTDFTRIVRPDIAALWDEYELGFKRLDLLGDRRTGKTSLAARLATRLAGDGGKTAVFCRHAGARANFMSELRYAARTLVNRRAIEFDHRNSRMTVKDHMGGSVIILPCDTYRVRPYHPIDLVVFDECDTQFMGEVAAALHGDVPFVNVTGNLGEPCAHVYHEPRTKPVEVNVELNCKVVWDEDSKAKLEAFLSDPDHREEMERIVMDGCKRMVAPDARLWNKDEDYNTVTVTWAADEPKVAAIENVSDDENVRLRVRVGRDPETDDVIEPGQSVELTERQADQVQVFTEKVENRYVARGKVPSTGATAYIARKDAHTWTQKWDNVALFDSFKDANRAIDIWNQSWLMDNDWQWHAVKLPDPDSTVEVEIRGGEYKRIGARGPVEETWSCALHVEGNRGLYRPQHSGFRSFEAAESYGQYIAAHRLAQRQDMDPAHRDDYDAEMVGDAYGQHTGIKVQTYRLVLRP